MPSFSVPNYRFAQSLAPPRIRSIDIIGHSGQIRGSRNRLGTEGFVLRVLVNTRNRLDLGDGGFNYSRRPLAHSLISNGPPHDCNDKEYSGKAGSFSTMQLNKYTQKQITDMFTQLWGNMCVCIYLIVHNHAIRPCHTNLPRLHVCVHLIGDQWSHLPTK